MGLVEPIFWKRFDEIEDEIFARLTITKRVAEAEERLHGHTLPSAWNQALAAGQGAEEKEVLQELMELRKKEAREKLAFESNNLPDGQPDKLGSLHDTMNRRGEGPSRKREKIFAGQFRHDNPQNPKPGWGRYRNQTREQIIKRAIDRVCVTGAAALEAPISMVLPGYLNSLLSDPEEA